MHVRGTRRELEVGFVVPLAVSLGAAWLRFECRPSLPSGTRSGPGHYAGRFRLDDQGVFGSVIANNLHAFSYMPKIERFFRLNPATGCPFATIS
jgi:hypothetical protein